jgi:hypothetical protein
MRQFTVRAKFDPEARVWCGSNDELPVASEADTLDGLVERVMEIAPEIASMNGLLRDGEELTIHFTVDQVARAHG